MHNPVKPEDISDDILNGYFTKYDREMCRESLAHFLNDAITAGLVSPPVYVVRSIKTGNLKGCECIDNLLIAPNEDSPLEALCEYEHWKGQTE